MLTIYASRLSTRLVEFLVDHCGKLSGWYSLETQERFERVMKNCYPDIYKS